MTEDQRNLVLRYMAARTIHTDGKTHAKENAKDVLQQLNESLGFNIKEQPDKVASVLEDAILSHDAEDVECALSVAGIVDFRPAFMPLLIKILELPWHRSHEEIASWFQYLKAPEPAEALYRAALVQHEYRAWDDNYVLARRCTWALADIGTPEAYEKLQLLAKCDIPMIAGFARKRIRSWHEEKSRKGS